MIEEKNYLDNHYILISETEIKQKGWSKGKEVFTGNNEYISLKKLKNILESDEEK